jgi:hypothetical protein
VDPHLTLDELLRGATHVAAAVTDALSTLQRHDAALRAADVLLEPAHADVVAKAARDGASAGVGAQLSAAAAAVSQVPSAAAVAAARALLASTRGPRLREALLRGAGAEPGTADEATTALLLPAAAALPPCPRALPPEAFGASVTGVR